MKAMKMSVPAIVVLGLALLVIAIYKSDLWLPVLAKLDSKGIEKTEAMRITSPDSIVDVVVMEVSAGATTGTAFKAYIVPVGLAAKEGTEIFVADQVVGLNLVWTKAKSLDIGYESARIFAFTNFWQSRDVEKFKYVIEIWLSPKR